MVVLLVLGSFVKPPKCLLSFYVSEIVVIIFYLKCCNCLYLLCLSKQCSSFKTRANLVKEGLEKSACEVTVIVNPEKVFLDNEIMFLSG